METLKCMKCYSDVRKSSYSKMTGYESYRCINKECNALYDREDFNNQEYEVGRLNKPKFDSNELDSCFETLFNNHYINMPPGREISLFIAKILEINHNAIGIFPSDKSKEYTMMRGNGKMNSDTFDNFIKDIETFLKKYEFLIFDELSIKQESRLADLIQSKEIDISKFFIIERSF
jgi:hypothetical protein